jgi:hypothetical protein
MNQDEAIKYYAQQAAVALSSNTFNSRSPDLVEHEMSAVLGYLHVVMVFAAYYTRLAIPNTTDAPILDPKEMLASLHNFIDVSWQHGMTSKIGDDSSRPS